MNSKTDLQNERLNLEDFIKTTIWRRVLDEKSGKFYYYEKTNKKNRQWKVPVEIAEYEEQLQKDETVRSGVDNEENKYDDQSAANNSEENALKEMEKQDSPPKSFQSLESTLNSKDSILDPTVIDTAKSLIQTHKQRPDTIVKSLVQSYVGYPQISAVLIEWIRLVKVLGAKSNSSSNANVPEQLASREHTEEWRVVDILSKLMRERFNRKTADEILDESESKDQGIPPWLSPLLQSPSFRPVFHGLQSNNTGSKFLDYCVQEIRSQDVQTELKAMEIHATLTNKFFTSLLKILYSELADSSSGAQGTSVLLDELRPSYLQSEDFAETCDVMINFIKNEFSLDTDDPDFKRPSKRPRTEVDLDGDKTAANEEPRGRDRVLVLALAKIESALYSVGSEVLTASDEGSIDGVSSSSISDKEGMRSVEKLLIGGKVSHQLIEKLYHRLLSIKSLADQKFMFCLSNCRVLDIFTHQFMFSLEGLSGESDAYLASVISLSTYFESAVLEWTRDLVSSTELIINQSTNGVEDSFTMKKDKALKSSPTLKEVRSDCLDVTRYLEGEGVSKDETLKRLTDVCRKDPASAVLVLTWLTETVKASKVRANSTKFLSFSQDLLRFVELAIDLYPSLLHGSFRALEALLRTLFIQDISEDEIAKVSAQAYASTSLENGALKLLIQIICTGYVKKPFQFLLECLSVFDAMVLRQMLRLLSTELLASFKGSSKRSFSFCSQYYFVAEMCSTEWIMKAVKSSHFSQEDLMRTKELITLIINDVKLLSSNTAKFCRNKDFRFISSFPQTLHKLESFLKLLRS